MVHGYGRCFAFACVGERAGDCAPKADASCNQQMLDYQHFRFPCRIATILPQLRFSFCNQPPSWPSATIANPLRLNCLKSASVGSVVLQSTVTGRGTAAREAKTGDKPPSPAGRIRLQRVACRTERTELMPSRLFPSVRHNCSREAGGRIANSAERRLRITE